MQIDPYEIVKEEVVEAVARAEALFSRSSTDSSARDELLTLLRSIFSDLGSLEDAYECVTLRRESYAVSDAELADRLRYNTATKERMQHIERELRGSVEAPPVADDAPPPGSPARPAPAPAPEPEPAFEPGPGASLLQDDESGVGSPAGDGAGKPTLVSTPYVPIDISWPGSMHRAGERAAAAGLPMVERLTGPAEEGAPRAQWLLVRVCVAQAVGTIAVALFWRRVLLLPATVGTFFGVLTCVDKMQSERLLQRACGAAYVLQCGLCVWLSHGELIGSWTLLGDDVDGDDEGKGGGGSWRRRTTRLLLLLSVVFGVVGASLQLVVLSATAYAAELRRRREAELHAPRMPPWSLHASARRARRSPRRALLKAAGGGSPKRSEETNDDATSVSNDDDVESQVSGAGGVSSSLGGTPQAASRRLGGRGGACDGLVLGSHESADEQMLQARALLQAGMVMRAFEQAKHLDGTGDVDAELLATLKRRRSECLQAIENLEGEAAWTFVATDRMGIATHFRHMDDGALCIKNEGFISGVEPAHLLAVYRLVALWPNWAPFCTSASVIADLGDNEMLLHVVYQLPMLTRDCVLHLSMADLLTERGCVLLIGGSVDSYPGVQLPPPATRGGRMTVRQSKVVIWPLETDKLQVLMISETDFLTRLPKDVLDFMLRKWSGAFLRRLVTEAQSISQRSRTSAEPNPYIASMHKDRRYFRHWVKRMKRYLSSLED